MRFAGEYHFPGGAKRQTDRGPLQTACRELYEEFGIGVLAGDGSDTGGAGGAGGTGSGTLAPPELAATLFCKAHVDLCDDPKKDAAQHPEKKLPRPAKASRAASMDEASAGSTPLQRDVFVFIADIAENAWLHISPEEINQGLRRRRQQFERLQASGAWWNLAPTAKAAIAPEVREVSWVPLSAALKAMDPKQPFVDDWQRQELARCGLFERELPLVTEQILRKLQTLGSIAAAKAASIEAAVEAAARDLGNTLPRRIDNRETQGGISGTEAPAWERALWHMGLQELRYQPGVPKRFDLKALSYNLNALPFGASLFGGPGHDFRDQRLQEFVERPELRDCQVLMLQECFATPFARRMLCWQTWLRQQLAERGFVHQAVSPLRVGLGYFTDSGLLIASKLPILESGFERFAGAELSEAEPRWPPTTEPTRRSLQDSARPPLHVQVVRTSTLALRRASCTPSCRWARGSCTSSTRTCKLRTLRLRRPSRLLAWQRGRAIGSSGCSRCSADPRHCHSGRAPAPVALHAAHRTRTDHQSNVNIILPPCAFGWQLAKVRQFVAETARHSGVPWLLAGDFNIDAIADHAVSDAFGYLIDSLPQESDEYRQMVSILNGGRGGVRDLLKDSAGQHVSTRPPRLQFPRSTAYIFKHKYPQRLDYLFFCDADSTRVSAEPRSTELATFASAPRADGKPPPYTHAMPAPQSVATIRGQAAIERTPPSARVTCLLGAGGHALVRACLHSPSRRIQAPIRPLWHCHYTPRRKRRVLASQDSAAAAAQGSACAADHQADLDVACRSRRFGGGAGVECGRGVRARTRFAGRGETPRQNRRVCALAAARSLCWRPRPAAHCALLMFASGLAQMGRSWA